MRKKKVLVVEDQKLNRAVLKEILESEYDVLYAVNGKEALDIMNREGRHLSLVLLDIVMPVMDGYEVLKVMERRKLLEQIPVLVASQHFGDDSELQALLLGAGDYVSKPYNPAVLKRRIKNQIRMHEALVQVTVLEKDPVTGLYNKASFNNRAVNIFEKYSEKKFDVIVIDIEHFKLYNSYYGFAEGDKLLRHIAEKLIELLFDKVSLCAREYGDRFLIICERKKDYFPKLYEGLTKDMEQYPSDIKIHLKFGVYEITDYTMEVTGMCDLAVCAMKRGKGVYDRNVVYYDESIEEELFWEQQITDDMEPALHNGEFQVYLQPKYDIFTEKMAGAEALVRWVHPVKGIIPPDKFIPIFEKNGFITELDMYVWDKTCELINEWIREDNKYVPVSVNVSRKDIYRQNLPEVFLNLLKKYHLKQKYLHIEITESAYTEDPEQLIKVVNQLKEAGFTIEMDDFGTGYSSLNMLAKLPIDILKLDMKIIQSYGQQNGTRSIINFIMGLAKWMNLYVVAEGVETKEQLELLKSMDCNYAQGYYFAKPMPENDFGDKLQNAEVSHMPDVEGITGDDVQIFVRDYDKDQIMLVIDDQSMNRAILADYFKDSFSVVEATNGESALDYFKRGGKADIIMLDIYMPRMDGFEVLAKLKADSSTMDIPVIVASQADDSTIIRAIRAGATDFVTKPFTREDAFRCVNHVLADLSSRIKKEDEEIRSRMSVIEKMAMTDFLTGLWNRAYFVKQVETYLKEYSDKECSFVMIDIDNFKLINDRMGHLTGDRVLQHIADKLKKCFREEDLLCRMGGDEFAVLLKAGMNKKELMERLDALHNSIRFRVGDIWITCSSGTAVCPADGTDFVSLYKHADKALFKAKRQGKDQNRIYIEENL